MRGRGPEGPGAHPNGWFPHSDSVGGRRTQRGGTRSGRKLRDGAPSICPPAGTTASLASAASQSGNPPCPLRTLPA